MLKNLLVRVKCPEPLELSSWAEVVSWPHIYRIIFKGGASGVLVDQSQVGLEPYLLLLGANKSISGWYQGEFISIRVWTAPPTYAEDYWTHVYLIAEAVKHFEKSLDLKLVDYAERLDHKSFDSYNRLLRHPELLQLVDTCFGASLLWLKFAQSKAKEIDLHLPLPELCATLMNRKVTPGFVHWLTLWESHATQYLEDMSQNAQQISGLVPERIDSLSREEMSSFNKSLVLSLPAVAESVLLNPGASLKVLAREHNRLKGLPTNAPVDLNTNENLWRIICPIDDWVRECARLDIKPALSMSRLLSDSKQWHREHPARGVEKIVFPASPFPFLIQLNAGHSLVYLEDSYQLFEEGETMQHCVYSYRTDCEIGKSFIYRLVNQEGKGIGTAEITREGQLRQLFGPQNTLLDPRFGDLVSHALTPGKGLAL